ncbi:hypothetical protein K9M79_07025 [Candidatus Woesearchaeota archaeon]|nr:hypothetical protein [Candidatus Woesearchaeota archaeon]
MKITIDTKTDSQEDIKRAIDLLQEYLTSTTPIQSDTTPVEAGVGMMDMFKSDDKEETKDDDIKILPY